MKYWTSYFILSWFVLPIVYSIVINIEVDDGKGWIPAISKAVPYGSYIKLRCIIKQNNNDLMENITLQQRKNQNSSTEVLKSEYNTSVLNWVIDSATFDSCGIYECISRSFSEMVMMHVYKFSDLQSVVTPTITFEDNVANIRLIRRQLDYRAFKDGSFPWLSCSFVVASEHLLEQITVHWEGGLLGATVNHTGLHTIYSQFVLRNATEKTIIARLRPNVPTLDSRVYGRYRCVFTFHKSESAVGTVDLKIPPILRLAFDPPPLPPANFSYHFSCKNPPCTANLGASNDLGSNATNWTGSCELVAAHPPVSASGLIWAWNEPQWAPYAIRRVFEVGKSTYLSEFSASGSLLSEKDARSPWQVLEQRMRRRRRDVATRAESYSEYVEGRPSIPVIFWCWTQNTEGETAVWWPGPSPYVSGFWASVFWPILGVGLELMSLCMVFGFFRYCHRKRQLRAYVHAPREEQVSFGLSRLIDSDDPRCRGSQQPSSGANSASEIKRINQLGRLPSVPYVRLSEVNAHSDEVESDSVGNTPTDNTITADTTTTTTSDISRLSSRGQGANKETSKHPTHDLTSDDLKTPIVANGQDTDEYFWDLAGTAVDGDPK